MVLSTALCEEGGTWVPTQRTLGNNELLVLLGPSERKDIGERRAEALRKRLFLLWQLCSSPKQEIIPRNVTFYTQSLDLFPRRAVCPWVTRI